MAYVALNVKLPIIGAFLLFLNGVCRLELDHIVESFLRYFLNGVCRLEQMTQLNPRSQLFLNGVCRLELREWFGASLD